jgi:hypothetical protein
MEKSNFGFRYLVQSQAQKELLVNENFVHLESLLFSSVASDELTSPPSQPDKHSFYIIPKDAQGEWNGYSNHISYYNDEGWNFIKSRKGMLLFIFSKKQWVIYDDDVWVVI